MKIRECQICSSIIPNRIKIDGKTKILSSRKRCLTCSPYGKQGSRTGIPGDPSKNSKNYSNWKEEWKKEHIEKISRKGRERKLELIRLAGGHCKKCNYTGPSRAMSFHHINSSEKSFPMAASDIRAKPWETVLKELDKCILLCVRCHAEVEEELYKDKSL